MSKSTKIIAALGVVAGLGVAALPAFTYAANSQSVSGSADIYAEVLPAIAMKIEGNNDDNSHEGTPGTNGVAKAKAPSTVTALDTLTSSDLANYSDTTAAVASSSWISLLPNASAHGSDSNGFKSTITVYTNDTGYTLGISGTGTEDALGAMTNQESGVTASIPANGIVKAGAAGWGYAVDTPVTEDATGSTANYQTAAATIKNGTGPTSGGQATKVYYGVSTNPDQATGTYKATVTYTATTNN